MKDAPSAIEKIFCKSYYTLFCHWSEL